MVVQTLNGALHQVNDYPVDKYNEEQLCYPLDRDLSGGWRCPRVEPLGPGQWAMGVHMPMLLFPVTCTS